MTPMSDLAAYERASRRLLALIGERRRPIEPALGRFGRATARLAQTRALLSHLGNPQNRYPIIHVTGTSGKGSVATMIAAILTAAGYRVGLRTSPYLQVATEKLQIGAILIDAQSLDEVSAEVLAAQARWQPGDLIGYPEAWSASTFLWFARERVDIAIVEVGAGGRFDSTNVFDPIVSVITSVGLDHTASLGPTLADIAWHKAGIIKPCSVAVVGPVPDEARRVIAQEVQAVGAALFLAEDVASSRFHQVVMQGAFQQANAPVAEAAITSLAALGFPVTEEHIASGFASARLPGRLEMMPGGGNPPIWLDGAHNPDKMAALTREIRHFAIDGFPPVVILGVLQSKDAASISAAVIPHARAIVATEPLVVGRASLSAQALAFEIESAGFAGPVTAEADPVQALRRAETLARVTGSSVVATGSMYLVGQLRRRWYPDDRIIIERTPWPSQRESNDHALPERSVAL